MKKQLTKTILLVEDEKCYRDILSHKLTKEGFSVVEANNGEEGLEVALRLHPDLIILDIGMPVIDGFLMLEKLRKEPWGSTADVLMLTTYQDKEKISKAMNLGTCDYCIKTEIEIEELVKKIQERLN